MVDAIGLKTKGKNSALSNQALVADSRTKVWGRVPRNEAPALS